jgi:RHS repeat-associated protein
VGNVLSVTDPVSNQTSYTYDAQNRVTADTNELGYTRTFAYDDNGNSVSTTDRNGRTREFEYDGLNRQVEENWLDDTGNPIRTTNSEYDAASQLIATDDPDSAYNFTYDELGRLVTVDNAGTPGVPNVVLSYNYDTEGNIVSVRDTIDGVTGATTAYSYDELDRVDKITQSGENVADKRVDFAYDALGQYESISRYSDLSETNLVADSSFTYDQANRLTNLTHSNSTTEIAAYDLAYDAANRITQIIDADGTSDYSYDQRDQLTAAEHSDGSNADETYSYDANGNRVSSSLHGSGYVTDANNRLASDGTYNYEYDHQGNLISQTAIATGKVQEFTWDYLNRLVAVVDKDSEGNETQKVEFTYDMFGRRLSKTVDGEATYFVYDRDNVILDFVDADGIEGEARAELEERYLHGIETDQILAQEDTTGEVIWHLSNHLGTIRDLVNNDGELINHLTYDSFGNVISETDDTIDTRYLYTGRELDEEIGLQYNRARYYAPELGRFIGEDPIGFEAEDSNLHRYVENNPLFATDPFGLESRSRYPLGHDHPDCIELAKQIESLTREIYEKLEEFKNDTLNLPGKDPNDHVNNNPASSRRGHKNKIDFLKAKRAEKIAIYQARCGDFPPPPCDQEEEEKPNNEFKFEIPDWVWAILGGVGRALGGTWQQTH